VIFNLYSIWKFYPNHYCNFPY